MPVPTTAPIHQEKFLDRFYSPERPSLSVPWHVIASQEVRHIHVTTMEMQLTQINISLNQEVLVFSTELKRADVKYCFPAQQLVIVGIRNLLGIQPTRHRTSLRTSAESRLVVCTF